MRFLFVLIFIFFELSSRFKCKFYLLEMKGIGNNHAKNSMENVKYQNIEKNKTYQEEVETHLPKEDFARSLKMDEILDEEIPDEALQGGSLSRWKGTLRLPNQTPRMERLCEPRLYWRSVCRNQKGEVIAAPPIGSFSTGECNSYGLSWNHKYSYTRPLFLSIDCCTKGPNCKGSVNKENVEREEMDVPKEAFEGTWGQWYGGKTGSRSYGSDVVVGGLWTVQPYGQMVWEELGWDCEGRWRICRPKYRSKYYYVLNSNKLSKGCCTGRANCTEVFENYKNFDKYKYPPKELMPKC